jgi:hypothetical protein
MYWEGCPIVTRANGEDSLYGLDAEINPPNGTAGLFHFATYSEKCVMQSPVSNQ